MNAVAAIGLTESVIIQSFNGIGDTRTPTYINFVCFNLFQLPFAYLLVVILDFGSIVAFWAITPAEVMIAIIGILWFKKAKWKLF